MEAVSVLRVRRMEALPGLDLAYFQDMIVYIHHQRPISQSALEAFEGYVSAGGGVLAIHSATASFTTEPRFTQILGGRFTGHGPVQAFQVHPATQDDPIFAGIPPFTVVDELYLHDLEPDIQPRFYAEHEGERVPVVWTRRHGGGRVCYACPGHRAASMRLPQYQQLLARGLEWVCGGHR